ncbi:Na+-transporting NADH:ubiquinone oxidoreductase subunit C [Mariniphaga anaerophila]|uniref:Na(+)-translocating NADH-quinone reductase subunit C n=1 Tax=Mariniphaga anaerophila TaxID=1484053 RepID=A0A1M4Y043_9BACT|nr:NADH:ubiquinone reductase (Na(+)-transporting) subunit C [Mariniphaga anaerophila]SHE99049.1 Na+-transporting NADH:ubiquinone oxidoreductase subunit C [Mariniphaga anaerophila]
MDRNSNTYTFIYAAVMVVLVAAVLASAATVLRPKQNKNVEIEKKQNILASVNIESTFDTAEKIYAEQIKKQYVVNSKGEVIDGEDAFTVDLKKEKAKPVEERMLPVFECQTESGLKYVFPMRGTGLWGPIWGFVSLNDDMSTIFGANFDHEGETPGLGAEIATTWFQEEFKGKKILDESGKLVSITVKKAGQDAPAEHSVDGISGGTITSKGLEQMLLDDFNSYQEFLMKKKS